MAAEPRPLRKHLEELRWRLFVVVMAVIVGAVVSVVFFEPLVQALLRPGEGYLSDTGGPIYTEVTELLGVTVKVALLGGLVIALPVLTYQVVAFVSPGLTRREKTYLISMTPAALLCFAAGAAFAYFVLIPPMLKFLLTYGADVAVPMIRISNYVNLLITLVFWMGVVFETPLIMFTAAKAGIVSPDAMARARRLIIVVAFLLGAMITPTFDPLNQTLVALPFLVLYEVGLRLARFARPKARREEAAEGSA
ncbi:MAG: twin-arginine translocase subunit TatC [Chloroflexi bacterium]|nr:twin-arginine translocase subunit TatC [Chloroflexota bacterium]